MSQSAQIAKVSPVHQRLADWLVANGGAGKGWNKRAAEHFGYTQAWLSTIYHSDAFQDYFQRFSQLHSTVVAVGLGDKVSGLAGQAVDELQRRMEEQGETLPLNQVLEIAELSLKRAAPVAQPGHNQTNNILVVSKEDLEKARLNMRGVKQVELKPEIEIPLEGTSGSGGTS